MKIYFLRITFFIFVFISISIIYYTKVEQKNFVVYVNPDGPDTTDYFIETIEE